MWATMVNAGRVWFREVLSCLVNLRLLTVLVVMTMLVGGRSEVDGDADVVTGCPCLACIDDRGRRMYVWVRGRTWRMDRGVK